MSLSRFTICVLTVCLPWLPANAQDVTPGSRDPFPFVARLERLQLGADVCALVSQTGEYRLERFFRARTDVFVGSLPASELQTLEQLLGSDELRQLSQQQIPRPLVSSTFDRFTIAIFGPQGTQNLLFSAPESRKPFRKSLDPIMHWLDNLQKAPHNKLSADSASHCMPGQFPSDAPASIPADAKDKGTQASSESAQQLPSAGYIVKMLSDQVYRGEVNRSCVIVLPSGRYKTEKSSQSFNGKRKGYVFEGSVGAAELQELRSVLDAPELVHLQSQKASSDTRFREGEFISFSIPRQGTVQRLALLSYFNVRSRPTDPGGMTNMRYEVEQNAKIFQPLRQWLKRNVEKNEIKPVRDAQPNDCWPNP